MITTWHQTTQTDGQPYGSDLFGYAESCPRLICLQFVLLRTRLPKFSETLEVCNSELGHFRGD